ncbi:MAG: M23 family metallopeptidase [Deltaproteobacteria bacterium]|nr:M23 family metallopeptidase [Deltaproteobacteria bacterium]
MERFQLSEASQVSRVRGQRREANVEKRPARFRVFLLSLFMVLTGFVFTFDGSAYPLKFPAHGEDLPYGHYWYFSQIHGGSGLAHDLAGVRYDFDNESWENNKPTGTGLDASIIFGQPLYASADGEVVSCWREFPDWPGASEYQENAHRATDIGNHLGIRTDDGHLVVYGHLQGFSIPESLCPNGSADGWLETVDPDERRDRTGTLFTEYAVPEGQRAYVRTGQFLGRVGHTGQSGGPHVHLQVQEVTENAAGEIFQGDSVPIQFTGAVYQAINNANPTDWAALNGDELNPLISAVGTLAILPDEGPKVSLSSRQSNRLDVFEQADDRQLRILRWNGVEWGDWDDLGGILTSAPACTSWSSSRIDCVARGQDLEIYHKYWSSLGGWSLWSSLGGLHSSAPAITSRNVNRLDVFSRGLNNELYIKSWTGGGWTGWFSLGGELSSSPACTSSNSSALDCFARGRNGSLWHKAWTAASGWQAWVDRGGNLTSAPSVSSRQSGHLDVFVRGGDWQLYFKRLDGAGWSSWSARGGTLSTAPASTSWGLSRVDIAVIGQNQHVWHKYWIPAGWSGFQDLED